MGLFSFDTFHGFLQSTNIFKRIKKIGELLEKENADVIMLQEAHTYLAINLLKTQLTSYPYSIYKHYLYGPRGGLVIFSKHPLEKQTYTNYQIRGSLLNKSFVAHVIRNGILICKVKGMPLWLFNTHLTPNMDYNYTKNNRFSRIIEAQLRQLANVIKSYEEKGDQVVIGGDFNADKNSYLYKVFTEESRASDLFVRETSPTQHQDFYPENQKVPRIDYLFLSGKTKPSEIITQHLFTEKVALANNVSAFLSDHIGLKATIPFDFKQNA
jgi:endonuclease/exonuclease/phosphatase family metal-dependent hydrolase